MSCAAPRTGALLGEVADERVADELEDLDGDLAERRLLVRDGLAALDPRDREVILLKFLGRSRMPKLARVLRCSESNAGTACTARSNV